jgi:hypothetical protein
MSISTAEQTELEKTLRQALLDISHTNPYRLKAGLRILMTTNMQSFETVCSPIVQQDLNIFKQLLLNSNPDVVAFVKSYV